MSEYYDTYFINPKRALKIAKQKNKVSLYNGLGTQICYYSGEKLKDVPANMIYLSLDGIREFFSTTSYRRPQYMDFIKSDYEDNDDLQISFTKSILNIFKEIDSEEKENNSRLFKKFNSSTPINLNQKNINFTIIVSKALKSNFYYTKQLSNTLRKNGHSVTILTEKGSPDFLIHNLKTSFIIKKLLKIEPNVIIFINDYKPNIIPENTYQISIINGFISSLNKFRSDDLREKDIILSQNQYINTILDKNGIPSKYIMPSLKINKKESASQIKRNFFTICDNFNDLYKFIVFQEMVPKLFKEINTNKLTIKKIQSSIKKTAYNNINDYEMMLFFQKNIIVQTCIQWVDSKKTNLQIVGYNWKKHKDISSNIKIKKKANIIKAYKNSKYVLHVSANIVNTQLLEILSSNAIPIVYDLRDEDKNYDKKFDNYCLFFTNEKELNNILNNELYPNKKDIDNLLQDYSYEKLEKQMINLIVNK